MAGPNRRSFVAGAMGAITGVAGCLQLEEADQVDDGDDEADQVDDDEEADQVDDEAPDRQLRVDVVGEQFAWTFDPEGGLDPRAGEVVLPAETEIRIEATSWDVFHAFAIASLGVAVDASPDGTDETRFRIDGVDGATTVSDGIDADRYDATCVELCGEEHSEMTADVYVVSPDGYATYLEGEGVAPPDSFTSDGA